MPTILERMASVYGEDMARTWLDRGAVHLDGEQVTDPSTPAPTGPHGARWVINPV